MRLANATADAFSGLLPLKWGQHFKTNPPVSYLYLEVPKVPSSEMAQISHYAAARHMIPLGLI